MITSSGHRYPGAVPDPEVAQAVRPAAGPRTQLGVGQHLLAADQGDRVAASRRLLREQLREGCRRQLPGGGVPVDQQLPALRRRQELEPMQGLLRLRHRR